MCEEVMKTFLLQSCAYNGSSCYQQCCHVSRLSEIQIPVRKKEKESVYLH